MVKEKAATSGFCRAALAACVLSGCGVGIALGDNENFHWAANSGNWDVGASWNENKVPGENDIVAIGKAGATAKVNVTPKKLRGLTVHAGGGVPTLQIQSGKTLEVVNFGKVDAGILDMNKGTWIGPLHNTSQGLITIQATAAADYSTIDSSSFSQFGKLNLVGSSGNKATMRLPQDFENNGTITLDAPATAGDARLEMGTGGFLGLTFRTLTNGGGATTATTPTINFNKGKGGTRVFSGNLNNRGIININTNTEFDSIALAGVVKGSFLNTGVIEIKDKAVTIFMKGNEFRNYKGNPPNETKGTVKGEGKIDVKGLDDKKYKNLGGIIFPKKQVPGSTLTLEDLGEGLSAEPAILEVLGDYEQLQAGELSIEVDASSSLVSHSQLKVTGDSALGIDGMAYLDSTSLVNVSLINSGEFLSVGQEFPILVADVLSGACPTLTTPSTYGVLWSVNCDTPNTVMLRVEAVPEPATAGFIALGCLIFGIGRMRRSMA